MAYQRYRNFRYSRYQHHQERRQKRGRMVQVKPYNEYWNKRDQRALDWSMGAVILINIVVALIAFFSKPQIQVVGHSFTVGQSTTITALIIGDMTWGIFELFTDKAKHWYDVWIKTIIAFIIGVFVGGILGRLNNFGQLVLEPAFNGNPYAWFFLISVLIFIIVLIASNAWFHKRDMIGSGKHRYRHRRR